MKELPIDILNYVCTHSYLAPDALGVLMHFQTRYLLTEAPLTQDYIDSFIQMYGTFYGKTLDCKLSWKERIENILRMYFKKTKDGTYSNPGLDKIIELSKKQSS